MTSGVVRIGRVAVRIAMATVGIVLPMAIAPAIASANNSRGGTITALWSGRVDWTEVYNPADPSVDMTNAGYDWQYSITVRSTAAGGKVVGKPSLQVNGKITEIAAPPNQGLDCSGTLSARRPSPASQSGPVGIVWVAPEWSLDWFIPDTGEWVLASGRAGSDCANTPNSGSPSPPCGPTISPSIALRPSRLPWTRTYSVSGTGAYPSGAVHCWMSASATLTFTGGGGAPSKIPSTPGRFRAKAEATLALPGTFERMLYPCIAGAATVPLYGLGPPGQVAAVVIGAFAGTQCRTYLQMIDDYAQIIKDPPLSSFGVIAKPVPGRRAAVSLPACSQWSGSAATFCGALEPALVALASAAQRSQSVAAAMKTTIARESGALKARNYAAVSRQDRALSGLDRQFAADQTAETAAGAAVANVMSAAGLPAMLSASQSATATATVVASLGRLGVSSRTLRSLLGAVSVPAPSNWLAALS